MYTEGLDDEFIKNIKRLVARYEYESAKPKAKRNRDSELSIKFKNLEVGDSIELDGADAARKLSQGSGISWQQGKRFTVKTIKDENGNKIGGKITRTK